MIGDLFFVAVFGLGTVYYLFSVLTLLAKPNKTDFGKLELNYHAALLAILVLALVSRLESSEVLGLGIRH